MQLLFYNDYTLGVLKDGKVYDASSAVQHADILPPEEVMERVIAGFDELRPRLEAAAAGDGADLDSVRVRAPLPRPHNALCAFSNYLDREGATRGVLDFFYKGTSSVIGCGDTVHIPDIPEAQVFQAEAEFAYVIGKPARNVSEADALSHVFGYTNFVDISARGIPNRRTTFLHKGQETWGPMGPFITTADEIADPQDVHVQSWINGELKQNYSTSAMAYSVAEQIAWLSQYLTLVPGDIISCGTHHVGLWPINDEDVVEVEGEGLGRLRFNIRSYGPEKTENWLPPGVRSA